MVCFLMHNSSINYFAEQTLAKQFVDFEEGRYQEKQRIISIKKRKPLLKKVAKRYWNLLILTFVNDKTVAKCNKTMINS
jgi:hypothetical protein